MKIHIKVMRTLMTISIIAILFALMCNSIDTTVVVDDSISSNKQQDSAIVDNDRVYESQVKSISMRLTPGQDLMTQVTKLLSTTFKKNKYTALSIISAVGSVNYCWLRMANQPTFTKIKGPMEIVSLSGTFDINLQPHVHISLSKASGETIGGHLPSLGEREEAGGKQYDQQQQQIEEMKYDCPIFTTLQLVLLSHPNLIYQRKIDPVTTYHELTIRKKHFYSKY